MRLAIIVVSLLLGAVVAVAFAEGMIWRVCTFTNPLTCSERMRYLPLAYVGGVLLVGPLTGGISYHWLDRWRSRRRADA